MLTTVSGNDPAILPSTDSTSTPQILNFSYSPEEIVKITYEAIRVAYEGLDQIGKLDEHECNVETVIEALAKIESDFRISTSAALFLSSVSTEKAVRDASNEVEKLTRQFTIDKSMREDLYRALKAVQGNFGKEIEGEKKRYLEKLLFEYKRNGFELESEKRIDLKEKMKRLSELETLFQQNIVDDKTEVLFSPEELDGCLNDFLKSLEKRDINGNSFYVATTKYPDVTGILKYAKSPDTRKKIDIAINTRASINEPILEEAILLRAEIAQMLGYKNHADYVLEDRLAKNFDTVMKFEEEITAKLIPLAKMELEKLTDLKAQNEGQSDGFYSWDFAYYSRLLMEADYAVDEQLIKQYFNLDRVIPEILRIYEEVLGLIFTRTDKVARWHEDVLAFQVNDAATGDLIGFFYLDLHPRDGKYTHAACFPLIPGYQLPDGNRSIPVAAILANISKPNDEKYSLLKHSEVITIFHEMGHAIHEMCSKTRYSRFHGTSVEWDFVEAPSQMLENWCWDRETLKRISSHYETGESLPEDLIERLVKTEMFLAGLNNLRQVFYGLFDMKIHSIDPSGLWEPIRKVYAKLRAEITLIPQPEDVCPAASFGHIMGGYDAGYYGYLWSKVFSSDMFASRFRAEGLQNPKTGLHFRQEILTPGGSRDGMESIIAFLGRETNKDAFFQSIGL
jgi:Zn-dependent oligopeptidase